MTIAKSANTWFQLPLETKLEYKSKLIQLHGLKCNRMNGNGCSNYFALDMLTIDHIIPISMGGPVCEVHKLQLLCFRCHKRKTMNIDNKRRAFEFASRRRISEKAVYLQARSNRIRSFYTENLPQKLYAATMTV